MLLTSTQSSDPILTSIIILTILFIKRTLDIVLWGHGGWPGDNESVLIVPIPHYSSLPTILNLKLLLTVSHGISSG